MSSIGWNGNDFIPYDKTSFFDGIDEFKPIYDSLSTKGDYEKMERVNKRVKEKINLYRS